jgi:MoaA/NifB/PqqE/SkfB family radical SAM enzyme
MDEDGCKNPRPLISLSARPTDVKARAVICVSTFRIPEKWIDPVKHNRLLRRIFRASLRDHFSTQDAAADRAIYRYLESRQFLPELVLVQIARVCNLKCTMCGWAAWGRNKGFMSMDLYRHILAEMKSNNILKVNLTNPQGEPLLSPHAIECVEIAIAEGFEVHLNTNCTPLNDKKIERLSELAKSGRLSIQASFSGYDKRSHEAIYVGSKFEATSEKLRKLNAAMTRSGHAGLLTVYGTIYDRDELKLHIDYLVSLGFTPTQISIGLPDNFAGIVEVGKKRGGKGVFSYKKDLDYRSLRLCRMLAYYMLVYDDGKVSACSCRDSENVMAIGDITKESLLQIRNGPRFKEMLAAFMRRDISKMPLCSKCDIPYGDYDNEKLLLNGNIQYSH